jgi:hypothetical protein
MLVIKTIDKIFCGRFGRNKLRNYLENYRCILLDLENGIEVI